MCRGRTRTGTGPCRLKRYHHQGKGETHRMNAEERITLSVCASVLWRTPFGCGNIKLNSWHETWAPMGRDIKLLRCSSFDSFDHISFVVRLLSTFDSFVHTFFHFRLSWGAGTCSCYLQSLLPCEDVKRDEAENNRRRIQYSHCRIQLVRIIIITANILPSFDRKLVQ